MIAATYDSEADASAEDSAVDDKLRFTLSATFDQFSLESAWRQIDSAGAHGFFLSWTWVGSWLQTLPPGSTPMLVEAWQGNSRVGLAILCQRRLSWWGGPSLILNASGHSMADGIMIEHNGFATILASQSPLMDGLAAVALQERDELVLSGTVAPAQQQGWLSRHHSENGFRTPLGRIARFGLEETLSRNARQQLRRSLRACQKLGPLSLVRAEDEGTAITFFNGMKALHSTSWEQRGRRHAFHNPHFEPFHRRLLLQGLKDGNVDLLKITAGETVLGYLYNFRRNGVVSNYQSGFDATQERLRPGYVCHALAMTDYAQRGEAMYDFLAGTNRLKKTLGKEIYTLHWQVLRRPTALSIAEHGARKFLQSLRGSGPPSWA